MACRVLRRNRGRSHAVAFSIATAVFLSLLPSPCQSLTSLPASGVGGVGVVRPHRQSSPLHLSFDGASATTRATNSAQTALDMSSPRAEVIVETPTVTQIEPPAVAVPPSRSKIVVFGASGRIGRRVVSRLLDSNLDLDVVAFVRDGRRFEEVMYDEFGDVGAMASAGGEEGGKRGTALQVVVGDLVSPADVFRKRTQKSSPSGFDSETYDDDDDDTDVDDDQIAEEADWIDETLRSVVSGTTVIISCAGTVRVSDWWTDYLKVPFLRIFRRDASQWCPDRSHPYYVNYVATKRVLELAEREQELRNAFVVEENDRLVAEERERELREERRRRLNAGRGTKGKQDEEDDESMKAVEDLVQKRRSYGEGVGDLERSERGRGRRNGPDPTDRIKIIRISDLQVGRSPFGFAAVTTNVFRSMVFRYQNEGEKLLQRSKLVDTIVLRPGDLTDAERNINTTWLQLSIDGTVPAPSLVGRDDVAELAVTAALTRTSRNELNVRNSTGEDDEEPEVGDRVVAALEGRTTDDDDDYFDDDGDDDTNDPLTIRRGSKEAHHYTWAVRWTGQHVGQGLRPDGLRTAASCFAAAIRDETKRAHSLRRGERKLRLYYGGRGLLGLRAWLSRQRRSKPYALGVAVAVYLTLVASSWIAVGPPILELIAKWKKAGLFHIAAKFLRLV